MKLNLGAADRHIPGYMSVDRCWPVPPVKDVEFWLADLRAQWPWADSSVDEIVAFDVIEHLPDRIHTMNEMHRVMKNGATAQIEVPNASKGAGFFQDPTHVSPWCMNSFQYFKKGSFAHNRFAASYGVTAAFHVEKIYETSWQDQYEITFKIHVTLVAVK